jgi:pre-mRNA-splicing factor CWC26
VDRGNGFEKDWFQARSRTARNTELAYQWQMDE